jgi:hypothetical protein
MKKQIAVIFFAGIAAMAALLGWANDAGPTGELIARALVAVMMLGVILGVQLVKRTHQRKTLSQEDGSIEKEMALKAQSGAYIDALVIMVLALAAVSGASSFALIVIVAAIVLLILSFWVRYQLAKRMILTGAGDEESHR